MCRYLGCSTGPHNAEVKQKPGSVPGEQLHSNELDHMLNSREREKGRKKEKKNACRTQIEKRTYSSVLIYCLPVATQEQMHPCLSLELVGAAGEEEDEGHLR